MFWFLYMAWLSVLLLLQPESAMYSVYMGIIATAVMILNVWAYTKNSVFEKAVFGILDKTRIEMSLKQKGSESDEEDPVTEEGGNG